MPNGVNCCKMSSSVNKPVEITMKAYGAFAVNGVEYDCEDNGLFAVFNDIQPTTPLRYGIDWWYLGDVFIEECNIHVVCDNGEAHTFCAETGLNEFVAWYYKEQAKVNGG